MQFAEAIAKLEVTFGPMAATDGFYPDELAFIGCGGVLAEKTSESPVLCVVRDTAIRLWLETMEAELRLKFYPEGDNWERQQLRWRIMDGPHCDKWRITIQDERCTHRIAADRYSVICTIGLAAASPPDEPEAQPDKD